MRKFLIILSVFIISGNASFASTDTVTQYFDKQWKLCPPENAIYFSKVFQKDYLWHRNDYFINTKKLQMTGSYLDEACTIKEGIFSWYNQNGKKVSVYKYANNEILELATFYDSGSKKSYKSYKKEKEFGWDEKGNLLQNFIVLRPPEASNDWEAYLKENLDGKLPDKKGFSATQYVVNTAFNLDTAGKISDIVIESVYPPCTPCGNEVVRVISNAPNWKPYIFNNEALPSGVKQTITFSGRQTIIEKLKRDVYW